MAQRTPAAEVEPTQPGADHAVASGAVTHPVADGDDQPDTDLSPKGRAALVNLVKLLARHAAEEDISQGHST